MRVHIVVELFYEQILEFGPFKQHPNLGISYK